MLPAHWSRVKVEKKKKKYSWHVRRSVINGKYTGMRLVQKRYLN